MTDEEINHVLANLTDDQLFDLLQEYEDDIGETFGTLDNFLIFNLSSKHYKHMVDLLQMVADADHFNINDDLIRINDVKELTTSDFIASLFQPNELKDAIDYLSTDGTSNAKQLIKQSLK